MLIENLSGIKTTLMQVAHYVFSASARILLRLFCAHTEVVLQSIMAMMIATPPVASPPQVDMLEILLPGKFVPLRFHLMSSTPQLMFGGSTAQLNTAAQSYFRFKRLLPKPLL